LVQLPWLIADLDAAQMPRTCTRLSGKVSNLRTDTGRAAYIGRGVCDSRLYEWGKALAQERHLAAHASGTHFSREDAEDIVKFTASICEYVFVLSEQFKDFMERRQNTSKHE
jgi:hypothetical protein